MLVFLSSAHEWAHIPCTPRGEHMSRQVITSREIAGSTRRPPAGSGPAPLGAPAPSADLEGPGAAGADDYLNRLLKYIPAEIVAVYRSKEKE